MPYSAPGDLAKAKVLSKPGTADQIAIPMELLNTAPGRVKPACPLFYHPGVFRWCGGCNFQHLSYDMQLKAKAQIAKDCLAVEGIANKIALESTTRSPQQWRYRSKLQVPFSKRVNGTIAAGFFHPGTHDVVDFEDCPVQSELSVAILREVKKMVALRRWTVYEEARDRGWLRHLLVRTTMQNEAMVTFVGNGNPPPDLEAAVSKLIYTIPQIKSVYLNVQDGPTAVVLGRQWVKLAGASQIEETLSGKRFLFYPGSFLQVNTPAAQVLYRAAADFLAMGERTTELYDLYCGVGTIGLTVGSGFKHVIGIEENAGAVACAWKNAERNNIRNARFIAGKAEDVFAKETHGTMRNTCTVLVDPPRKGLAPGLISRLSHPMVKKLLYVSCNADSFARDAQMLRRSGYVLKRVRPIDLFPQTSHVELVSYFERMHRD